MSAGDQSSISLWRSLELFNRKERNLLIRDALGNASTYLDRSFLKRVESSLGISISEQAWWATDFHFDWLAAGIAHFGETLALSAAKEIGRSRPNMGVNGRLIKGNQEDIDLVIVNGLDLVLIEAKAFGPWDNSQLDSKRERLDLLLQYVEEVRTCSPGCLVNLHFLLISRDEPKRLSYEKWPSALKRGEKLPWMKLAIPEIDQRLTVTRCGEDCVSAANGTHWMITEFKR